MAQQESTSSRLIRQLKEISRGTASPLGFGRVQASGLHAMLLVASLDRNDAALAEAAVGAGADVLELHLHGKLSDLAKKPDSDEGGEKEPEKSTPAAATDAEAAATAGSGEEPKTDGEPQREEPAKEAETTFGSLADERSNVEAVLKVAGDRAVGIVVGDDGETTMDELNDLAKLGVDFVVIHPHRAPVGLLSIEALGHVARLDRDYSSGPLRGLNEMNIDAMELTIGRPDGSLSTLTIHDLAHVRQVVEPIRRPVLLLITSSTIGPEDLKHLRELGIEALVLAPSVLGKTPDEVKSKIAEYRQAIDKLGPPLGRGRGAEGRRVILPRVKVPSGEEEGEEDDDDDE